ncbi:uncharacterized protein LOC110675941 [Aedes aegypti]|uniref:Uncharacterized protein n=1 Tax=Aedes aegypti TaxID=7159 RepID=A0A6I8TT88_AEDAE|nr:uncharacterized protein LOC110675941 [Aedes aegypti]
MHHILQTNVLIISVLLFASGVNCARVKEYVQEKAATCPVPNADKFAVQFPGPMNFTSGSNVVKFYGNFTVTETIQEPLEIIIATNRCTLDMKTCELFNKLTLSDLCRYINDQKGVWASFFKSMEPDFRCPIKPGLYKFVNSVVDLSFSTNFPLEGYRWQTSLKLYSTVKPKRELFCISSQSFMRWIKKP